MFKSVLNFFYFFLDFSRFCILYNFWQWHSTSNSIGPAFLRKQLKSYISAPGYSRNWTHAGNVWFIKNWFVYNLLNFIIFHDCYFHYFLVIVIFSIVLNFHIFKKPQLRIRQPCSFWFSLSIVLFLYIYVIFILFINSYIGNHVLISTFLVL